MVMVVVRAVVRVANVIVVGVLYLSVFLGVGTGVLVVTAVVRIAALIRSTLGLGLGALYY